MRTTLVVSSVLCILITGSEGLLRPPYCTPNEKCYPTKKELKEFGESLVGRLILKNQKEYKEQSEMINIIEQRSPYVIVMVQDEKDIRAALLFAKTHNLRVAIRSSGHSLVGRSTADDAFVINLSEMRDYEIKLNDKRYKDGVLITQTGIPWGELYDALGQVDRIAVGGACPTVTPGGYTLGGGHSPISKTFGYAVDNVLEARVVLVDGSYATCTERKTVIERVDGQREVVNDGDLFWALKGGGGGTFGVVVYLVFKIHKAPESVVAFRAALPLESDVYPGGDLKTEAFDAFFSAFPFLSDEWGGNWAVDNFALSPEQRNPHRGTLHVSLLKVAPWDGSEPALFSDLLALSSTYNLTGELVNMTSYVEGRAKVFGSGIETTLNAITIGTFLLPQVAGAPLSAWYKTSLFDQNQNANIYCFGIVLGGATQRLRTDSPLHPGFRQSPALLFCLIMVEGNEHIQEVDTLAQSMKALGYGEYFNEPTKNNQAWKEDYWGMTNYQRLLDIKYRYDPTIFLTCHQCVASDITW